MKASKLVKMSLIIVTCISITSGCERKQRTIGAKKTDLAGGAETASTQKVTKPSDDKITPVVTKDLKKADLDQDRLALIVTLNDNPGGKDPSVYSKTSVIRNIIQKQDSEKLSALSSQEIMKEIKGKNEVELGMNLDNVLTNLIGLSVGQSKTEEARAKDAETFKASLLKATTLFAQTAKKYAAVKSVEGVETADLQLEIKRMEAIAKLLDLKENKELDAEISDFVKGDGKKEEPVTPVKPEIALELKESKMECVALDPKDTTKVTLTHTLSEDKKSLVHSVDITRILNGAIAGIAGGNNVKETVPAVVIMGGSTTYTLAGLKGFELKFNHSLATGREVLTLNSDKKAIDLKCSDVK